MVYHPCRAKRFPPDIRELLSQDADRSDVRGIVILLAQATPRLSVRGRLGEMRVPTLLIDGAWEKRFQAARNWLLDSQLGRRGWTMSGQVLSDAQFREPKQASRAPSNNSKRGRIHIFVDGASSQSEGTCSE